MIDFTNCEQKKKTYGGANGNKISIIFDNELYMLKMPCIANKNDNLSYSNSTISEYLGCNIFNMLGVEAQTTLLGTYKYHDTTKIAVACKDFTNSETVFLDFASVKNSVLDSSSNGFGTKIEDILYAIDNQKNVDQKLLRDRFWDMFVIDAFIGNWDRHNGNWGFIYNQRTDHMSLAPVFDCGSSLYPQVDEELMKKILSSTKEMNARIYDIPTSSILFNGHRGNYFEILTAHKIKDLDEAIERIIPKIKLEEINTLIDSVEYITDLHKKFLKTMLKKRKELILDVAIKQK